MPNLTFLENKKVNITPTESDDAIHTETTFQVPQTTEYKGHSVEGPSYLPNQPMY